MITYCFTWLYELYIFGRCHSLIMPFYPLLTIVLTCLSVHHYNKPHLIFHGNWILLSQVLFRTMIRWYHLWRQCVRYINTQPVPCQVAIDTFDYTALFPSLYLNFGSLDYHSQNGGHVLREHATMFNFKKGEGYVFF